jgi:hypothetical protein
VVLPRQGGHAQPRQFVDGRGRSLRITRRVPDHQLERDPAGRIDIAHGQLEAGEQVPARLDPARPTQRDERTDLHAEDPREPRRDRPVT